MSPHPSYMLVWLRICFIDFYKTVFGRFLLFLSATFFITEGTAHTYYIIYIFNDLQFVKYAPEFCGRFYVLVCISYIYFFVNNFDDIREGYRWSLVITDKDLAKAVSKRALYITIFSVLALLVSMSSAVLFVIPQEDDVEYVFFLKLVRDYLPLLYTSFATSIPARLPLFVLSLTMNTPCYQIIYILHRLELQLDIIGNTVKNINAGVEEVDGLFLNQEEIKNRLVQSCQHHADLVCAGSAALLKFGRIFIVLFAVTGMFVGMSIVMILVMFQDETSASFKLKMYVLMVSAVATLVLLVRQGQSVADKAEDLFDTLCESRWYCWNRENKQIYGIFLTNTIQGFSLKFSQNVSVTYELGIEIVKAVYSMVSFFTYIREAIVHK